MTTPTSQRSAIRAPLLIGRYHQPVIADTDVHPESLAAFEDASALLESLGHRVVDIDVPLPLDAVPHFELVWAAGAAGIPVPPSLEGDLRPLTRWLRERGRALLPGRAARRRSSSWPPTPSARWPRRPISTSS